MEVTQASRHPAPAQVSAPCLPHFVPALADKSAFSLSSRALWKRGTGRSTRSAIRISGLVAAPLANERVQQAGDLVESGSCGVHPPAHLGEPAAHLGP
jgi:hypothetical protein